MNRSVIIAVVMAVAAFLWIMSGSFSGQEDQKRQDLSTVSQNNNGQDSENKALFKVKTQQISAVDMLERINLQGGIESARVVDIKAEVDGTIVRLVTEKGASVKDGQLLYKISLNDRLARLERAKAELKVSQIELESGESLKAKKLLSENSHQKNLAAVSAAKAQVKEIETEIAQTSITAPFAGILDESFVELGDYVSTGTSIAKLVDDSGVKISVQVPQQHISKIRKGQIVEAELLDGSSLVGKVTYIASSADPLTRSFTVEALADNAAEVKHFGQSARVSLIIGSQRAHKLSPAVLSLDKEGDLQVKGVDESQRVYVTKVKLLRSENDGIWVSGLPDTFKLISVGQGFVSPGQVVEVAQESLTEQVPEASVEVQEAP